MANSNFNYLKKDVANWLPLSVLNRTNERWEDGVHYNSGEATANFGGGSTEEYGTKILYAFGLGAPAGSRPLYYTTENFGNLDFHDRKYKDGYIQPVNIKIILFEFKEWIF